MSSLQAKGAHVLLQQNITENIPHNGDKDYWLWMKGHRTNPNMEIIADGAHRLSASPSCNVPPEGGIITGPQLSPTPHHTSGVFPINSATFGSSSGSLWQHLCLSLQISCAKPEQTRACFACLIWQGHPAHSSPHEALGFLIWFISCHFGHSALLWLASQQLLPFMSCLPKEAFARREGEDEKREGEKKRSPKIQCVVKKMQT